MGRLAVLLPFARRWAPPLLLSLGLLFGFHAAVGADPNPTTDELASYLQLHELNPITVQAADFDQVGYAYNHHTVMLTSDGYNDVNPASDGPYVVWQGIINGSGQIFLYNVLTTGLTQLTNDGQNQSPAVNQGHVVWQAWDGHHWQVKYYDGTTVTQITNASQSSIRPSIRGQQIIYAVQLDTDSWQTMSYDTASSTATLLVSGDTVSTAYPHFNADGSVSTAFTPY
jgi:beta propeller repeat protein